MNKNFIYLILIIIVGSYSNDFFNKKSDLLNKEISNKKNKIINLNKKILSEKIEYNFLINPERIKKLSKENLNNDYITYEKKNIKKFENKNQLNLIFDDSKSINKQTNKQDNRLNILISSFLILMFLFLIKLFGLGFLRL